MAKESDEITQKIENALHSIFNASSLMDSLNYVGVLNRLLHTGEAHATQAETAYIFIEKSWAYVNYVIKDTELKLGINDYSKLPSELNSHISEIIGTWQSLLRYHPRGDKVHLACVDIINKSDMATLKRFVWFLDRVNSQQPFIDPQDINMAKKRLFK